MSDMINLIDGLIGEHFHGPMHRFRFARCNGVTGVKVELLLRQYGIRVWGRDIYDPDAISFLVKRSQAEWAEYVLCRAGIPLISPPINPKNAEYRRSHAFGSMPTPWNQDGIEAKTFVDHVVNWIHRILD